MLVTATTPVGYATDVLPGWVISGIGIGLALPSMIATAAVDLPPAESATGSAVVNTARQLGYVLGVAMLVAVLGSLDDDEAMLTAFRHGWSFVALVAAAGAATAFGITPRTRQSQSEPK
ncbi:hypothetical protein ABZ511_24745 [Nocardia gamkensis]